MSSAVLKAKLKAARVALDKKDFQSAHDTSLQILEYEPDNYFAKIFYGSSSLELDKIDQSEQAFRSAIELSPKQLLGWQGLRRAYERGQKWDKCAETLLELAILFANSDDATRCADALEKLIDLRREHGSRHQLVDALSLYLPDSAIYPTLSTLPAPDLTNPTDSTTASSQAAIYNSLPILEEIVSLNEADETETLDKEIGNRRTRIHAGSPQSVRNEVIREVYGSSKLPYLYDEILNHPNTSDELRRQTESKLLRRKRDHLFSLPLDDPMKRQLAIEVEKLISGVVLLRIPDELAWSAFIEGQNFETIEEYDFDILHQYVKLFPEQALARLMSTYLAYLGVPLSDEDEKSTPTASLDDVFGVISVLLHPARAPVDLAKQKTEEALQSSIFARKVMAEVYLHDQDYQSTVTISEAGLELVNIHRVDTGSDLTLVKKAFNVALATSLVHLYPPKHHTRALRILEDVLSEDPNNVNCLMGRGYVLQRSGKWSEAASCFSRVTDGHLEESRDTIRAQEEHAWCQVQLNRIDMATTELRTVIELLENEKDSEEDKSRCWWRLGRAYWEMGADHREEAFKHFITSLKHSSSFAPAFTSLGIYYSEAANPLDPIRASKCFQKAFELDAREGDAARRLAEGFAEEREWDLVEVIANRTIEGEGGFESSQEIMAGRYLPVNAWAWKASGVVHLNRGSLPSAIQAFQVALRADPEDQPAWVRLGESYSKAGRHAAAFKALHRAEELLPEDWMCAFLIGDVHRQTGRFQDAIESFHSVLQVQPDEPGVLTSLARTHIDLGLSELSTGFISRAQDSFMAALQISFQFLDTNTSFHSFVWKVIADAIYNLSRVSFFTDEAAIRSVLLRACGYLTSDFEDRLAGSVTMPITLPDDRLMGTDALKVAVAAYSHRISLGLLGAAATGSAWFDFGLSLFNLARRIFPEGEQRDRALKQALASIKEAIRAQPGEDNYWRALGDMSLVSQPKEAQHAYIRALEINPKNIDIWTSFGFLCFYHDDLELANEAFLKAQTLDPDHTMVWVGQALIATRNGHHADSRMLFEHAVSLSADVPEADIAFSRREFDQYLRAGHASPNDLFPAFFALDRYLKQRPDDATALHIFGLVCERIGHIEHAIEHTDHAITVLEAAYEETEDPIIERQYIIANTTVARLRLAMRDYEGALNSYQTALGLLPEEGDGEDKVLRSQCLFGSGLASFKLGTLDVALENFEAALVTAGDDLHMRGHVTVLLAQTMWAIGTEEGREAAKTQLLDCITQDPENLTAISALAGMGILTDDDGLIDAALSELKSLPLDLRHRRDPRRDFSYILKQHHLGQGNLTAALSEAQKAVHVEPAREDARRTLATLLLQCGEPAAARAVLFQAGENSDIADLRASIGLRAVARALSGDEEGLKEAWSLAQKGIMLAPWDRASWNVLAYIKSCR